MTLVSEPQPRPPLTPDEWRSYFDLRWRVLREPWNQPPGSERDDFEDVGFHLGVWTDAGLPLAIGRIHLNSPDEAQVRFMAVAPGEQQRGFGGRILSALEKKAIGLGASRIILNAREEVQAFYRKHGYQVIGPAPLLFGQISHYRMEKKL